VTSFGLFVQLDELYVEGLVHITELGGEYYRYDEARQELRGERTGVRYGVGGRIRVQVSRVDLDGRKIDFRLVRDALPAAGRPPARERAHSSAQEELAAVKGADQQLRQSGRKAKKSGRKPAKTDAKTAVTRSSSAAAPASAAVGVAAEAPPTAAGKSARRSGVKEPSAGSAGAGTKGRRSRR
jgi:ribonuclease R